MACGGVAGIVVAMGMTVNCVPRGISEVVIVDEEIGALTDAVGSGALCNEESSGALSSASVVISALSGVVSESEVSDELVSSAFDCADEPFFFFSFFFLGGSRESCPCFMRVTASIQKPASPMTV